MSTINISHAAEELRAGNIVAIPTETVYGLAANAQNGEAVAKIYEAKGRPSFNPLIIHVEDIAQARALTRWNANAETLASAFWPGPLTLVLPRAEHCPISLLASAGMDTLAIRMPAHRMARELLRETGFLLAAPSANRSGRISPTRAQHVQEELPGIPVLDGGPCEVGLESTIVNISGEPTLLRPGAVTVAMLERALNARIRLHAGSEILAPGMLESHYAPALPVRLNAEHANPGEALLAFGPSDEATLNLSESNNLREAAANLFAYLRALDTPAYTAIAIMPIPEEGLGVAINDRLRRAAA